MNVLVLSWEFPPYLVGGLGRHTGELTPALAQQGVRVQVVTPVGWVGAATVADNKGVTVHYVYTPALNNGSDIYAQSVAVNEVLQQYLEEVVTEFGPYDVIHNHDWLTAAAARHISQAWEVPMLTTVHATERGRSRGHLTNELQTAIDKAENSLVHEASRVIVCSQHMAREVQYFFQVPKNKVDVIPNGVYPHLLDRDRTSAELTVFRRQYASPDEFIVFTVGRLVYEKGIHLLVQAAPRILDESPQTRILIAGKGPEAENLEQQAHNLGVSDRVNFLGFITDEERNLLLKVSDCAVFPSLYEPFGIVALEAMALGCSLIVSDVGGLSEIVTHEETGIKIYPDNVDSTAWGVTHALTNPVWRERHAAKARESVETRFNWHRIARLTANVYEQLTEEEADAAV